MSGPRRDAIEIWNAAVDSVKAAPLVQGQVLVDGDQLVIDEYRWSRRDFDRVIVIGAGKACTAMAAGLLLALDDWLPVVGWVNVPEGTESDLGCVHTHPARPAGVNEPTTDGVRGTQEILRLVSNAGNRDLLIALISGGGSALLPAPIEGISLQEKRLVTRFLSAVGADIVELNTVRKHLSRVKGGGLLRACRGRHLITLILSDVLGDPLDLIASGPTVPDESMAIDAVSVLKKYDPQRHLPTSIYQALQAKVGELSEFATRPPSPESSILIPATTIVIGNNAMAVDEAGIVAERLGYNHIMHVSRGMEGSAEDVGQKIAEMALTMLHADPGLHRTDCLITGGEPTVSLADESVRGKGGRNQQLVLAAYERLLQEHLSLDQWQRLCILSGGTDGEDGPTDAAGALLDHAVHERAKELELDAGFEMKRNNAYEFFQRAGGLLITGPTGTNVCDVRVCIVKPRS